MGLGTTAVWNILRRDVIECINEWCLRSAINSRFEEEKEKLQTMLNEKFVVQMTLHSIHHCTSVKCVATVYIFCELKWLFCQRRKKKEKKMEPQISCWECCSLQAPVSAPLHLVEGGDNGVIRLNTEVNETEACKDNPQNCEIFLKLEISEGPLPR